MSEIVIAGVTTTRRSEIDWLYRGVGRFFPEAWERFRAGVPEAERDGDLVAAYARLMESPDDDVRAKAAADWVAWEDAVISQEPHGTPGAYSCRPPAARLALVRICAHYFSHGAWLEEGALLRDASRLAGIPGVLIHGRLDLGSPLGHRLGARPRLARRASCSSSATPGIPAATQCRTRSSGLSTGSQAETGRASSVLVN